MWISPLHSTHPLLIDNQRTRQRIKDFVNHAIKHFSKGNKSKTLQKLLKAAEKKNANLHEFLDLFEQSKNIRPASRDEIESALSAHPDVLSCLVVGVPHDDLGQVPYAIVQADGLDEAAVTAFLSERIAGYKVPRTVEFSETPLRDDAGKARRSAVRDEIIARRQAQARQ